MYSFGLILLQVVAGIATCSEAKKTLEVIRDSRTSPEDLERHLKDPALAGDVPQEILSVAQLATDCTNINDKARPKMTTTDPEGSSVIKRLEIAWESLTGEAAGQMAERVVCFVGFPRESGASAAPVHRPGRSSDSLLEAAPSKRVAGLEFH